MKRLLLLYCFTLFGLLAAHAQPSDPGFLSKDQVMELVYQEAAMQSDTGKLKFFGKIGHWLGVYTYADPDYLLTDKSEFKNAAFANLYIEPYLDHDNWLYNLLNRVTEATVPAKYVPYIMFRVVYTPTDENITSYNVKFEITASKAVSINLEKLSEELTEKHLLGKTYTTPSGADTEVTAGIQEAITKLKTDLGSDLAPDLMVRYADEVYWNGMDIIMLDDEGNFLELEAIDKEGKLIPYSELDWTNANGTGSRGIVDMTGAETKSITLKRDKDELTVTVRREALSNDLNDLPNPTATYDF